jgi:hypothetical protein
METIKMDKKYQTRDGRAVRILAIDEKSQWSVVGRIMETYGRETLNSWMADGKAVTFDDSPLDLIPVPTKHEGWGVIIKSGSESAGIAGQINLWLTSTLEDTEYKIRQRPEANWHLAHVTWED